VGHIIKCGVFHKSFTGNSATFHNEGSREVGLEVGSQLVRLLIESNVIEDNPQLILGWLKEIKEDLLKGKYS